MRRDEWHDWARKLDWEFSYVSEREAFPEEVSGQPWLSGSEWRGWDEPFRTSYTEYVTNQAQKEAALEALRDAMGRVEDYERLPRAWLSVLKLHGATLPLAEFAAVVGNLRAGRFGRDSAWRTTATFGALDELRHTQLPLRLMHDLVRWDAQFDWVHRCFHTENWIAIAARHFVDELLLGADPIEFAVATNFVFETGFTNIQFVGLSQAAHATGDRMFEKMIQSIQTDEARHSQIGDPVLREVIARDPERAQYLVDKWFWRSWLFFSIVTGFAIDYLVPLRARKQSFKELVVEWVLDQFQSALDAVGLRRPWYWERFIDALDSYHHMVYATAYTYRATTWFDFALPGPAERAWLKTKYPKTWPMFEPIWARITKRLRAAGPEVEWYTHGVTPVTFCHLCQLVLCGGTPAENSARVVVRDGEKRWFCSEPCQWIFEREPERYGKHKDVVQQILVGQAPGNLLELLRHFGLSHAVWGKDASRGRYFWLEG